MPDPTEPARRALKRGLDAAAPSTREEAEEAYGRVWSTAELQADFRVRCFLAPFVMVTRKSDGARGSLAFSHRPRWYHTFTPEDR
jgi:hypothetical protein